MPIIHYLSLGLLLAVVACTGSARMQPAEQAQSKPVAPANPPPAPPPAPADTTPPTAPVASAPSAAVAGQLALTWAAASDLVTAPAGLRYEICQSTVANACSTFAVTYQTAAATLSYTATGLTGGTTYYFRVRAVDAAGNAGSASNEVSALVGIPEISQWKYIDGSADYGVVGDSYSDFAYQKLAVCNGKLYAIWREATSSNSRVRSAVFNGDVNAPSWKPIDGVARAAMNAGSQDAFSPNIACFNNKVYASWSEPSYWNSGAWLRLAVFNGNETIPVWTFVDKNNTVALQVSSSQMVVHASKLYLTHTAHNGGPWARALVYNGNDASPDWFNITAATYGILGDDNSYDPMLAVHNGSLFVTWAGYVVRAALYTGSDSSPSWTYLDNENLGVNRSVYLNRVPKLVSAGGRLHVLWTEPTSSSSLVVRARMFNENYVAPSWTFIERAGQQNIHKKSGTKAYSVAGIALNDKLYASWVEQTTPGNPQIRVAVFNGSTSAPAWSFVDGNGDNGLNRVPAHSVGAPDMVIFNNKLVIAWPEADSAGKNKLRVAIGQ